MSRVELEAQAGDFADRLTRLLNQTITTARS